MFAGVSVQSMPCRGLTIAGQACKRTTRNLSGWCGSCAGVPAAAAAGVGSVGGPGPDPLTVPGSLEAKEWQPPRERAKTQVVAQDPHTSPAALDTIARSAAAADPTDTMQMVWVAENPAAAPETLRFLVGVREQAGGGRLGQNHDWVEAAVAKNPCSPDDALAHLAARAPVPNRSPNVPQPAYLRSTAKQRVAQNPAASPRTLTVLAGTVDGALWAARWAQDPDVVDRAVATAQLAGGVPDGPVWSVTASAAENPAVTDEQLTRLLKMDGPDCPVARNAARRPVLSDAMADRLASHPDHFTRLYLLQNPGAPPAVLARFATDPAAHPDLRSAAATHPDCPAAATAAAGLLAD